MIKKNLIILIFLFTILSSLFAQQLSGIIKDEKGSSIANSTVYIREANLGIAADKNGKFQTNIGLGEYTIEFRSFGYQTIIKKVTIGNNNVFLSIVLKDKSYVLNELILYPDGEDPAYRIMRKAIIYAPYHQYQVNKFNSETYIKGCLTIEKAPKSLQYSTEDGLKKMELLINRPMILESKSEIHFTSPYSYKQHVLASKSSLPKEFNADKIGLSVLKSNIYSNEFNKKISPLSPKAFSLYTFKLENMDYSSDHIVNKIRVSPRKKNAQLFYGYIYILENNWSVYAIDLTSDDVASTWNYKVNYHQVEPNVYMPTSYDISVSFGMMGVKGNGRYYYSIKYKNVEVNKLLAYKSKSAVVNKTDINVSQPLLSNKQQALNKKIDNLLNKKEISTKETIKLAKMIAQSVEPEQVKQQRESLEIKDLQTLKISFDSLAYIRDSIYWANNRVLPLYTNELNSYISADSINLFQKNKISNLEVECNPISIGSSSNTPFYKKILTGTSWQINPKMRLSVDGVNSWIREYNYVDGFWIGNKIDFNYKISSKIDMQVQPLAYYTTARKKAVWHIQSTLNYSPMMRGRFKISAGNISSDINSYNGISRLYNSMSILYFGYNFINLYNSNFFRIENQFDVCNGLNFSANFETSKNMLAQNNTRYNLFKLSPKNSFNNTSTDVEKFNHKATKLSFKFTYTPFYRYKINSGKKYYVGSKYPTFSVEYENGIDLFNSANAPKYNKVELSVLQSINVSPFQMFDYLLSAGFFFDKKNMHSTNYKYFSTNAIVVSNTSFNKSFQVLPNYTFASQRWIEGHATYKSQYLLLKNIAVFQDKIFDESIHLHALMLNKQSCYLEYGYSFGVFDIGNIGIFVGFKNNKFDGAVIKFTTSILNDLDWNFR